MATEHPTNDKRAREMGWMVASEAGDGINGRIYVDCASADGIDDAKSAVASQYGDGTWGEVAASGKRNAWEYFTGEDGDSVARIEPVVQIAGGWEVE